MTFSSEYPDVIENLWIQGSNFLTLLFNKLNQMDSARLEPVCTIVSTLWMRRTHSTHKDYPNEV